MLILLATLRMLTTLLPPAEYGLLALFTVFQSLAGLILINPPGQYLTRHTHEWHDAGSLSAWMHQFSRYRMVAALATGSVAGIWFMEIGSNQGVVDGLWVAAVVAFAIYAITEQGARVSRLNMLGHRRESVLWQLVSTVLGLIFSATMVSMWPSALVWLAGQAMGAWLGYVGAQRAFERLVPKNKSSVHVSLRQLFGQPDFLRFCTPLVLVTSLLWLEGNGYRLILERGWSLEWLGLFTLALSVPAQMTAALESIVMQLVYPYFYRALAGNVPGAQKCRAVTSMVNTLLPLYILWGAFLLLAARPVLELLANTSYHAAGQWVLFGVAVELARLISNVWQLVAQAEKDFSSTMLPFAVGAAGSLIGAGLAVWLNWTPSDFATVLLVALYLKMLLVVIFMRARMPVRVSWRRTLPALAVLVVSAACTMLVPQSLAMPWSLVYLAAVFGVVAIPAAIHLRTSPDVRFLFSRHLRGGQ